MDGCVWIQTVLLALTFITLPKPSLQGPYEKALLEYLFVTNKYNILERPAANDSEPLEVQLKLTLQQIIDVDEKNQIISSNVWLDMDEKNQIINTNVWLDLSWNDYSLTWDPQRFGGIAKIRLPPKQVWRPDILMYNSADESFDGTYATNVVISHDGSVSYIPPGMFKSTCKIDITWFPFDDQRCDMKFGSWTYDGTKINLTLPSEKGDSSTFMENGEWDLIGLPGVRHEIKYECCPETYLDLEFTVEIRRRKLYYFTNLIVPCIILSLMTMVAFLIPPDAGEKLTFDVPAKLTVFKYECCPEPYIDITFTIHIRRRTLYYGFNLIIPCVLISSMALLTFVLPPDAGEKISLGVTILLSLTVFLLLVAETMPPTSDAVPLIGMYFACIMMMCSLSVVFTVLVLNYHHRSAETHEMPTWVKKGVCEWLAWGLRMRRPGKELSRKKLIQNAKLRELEMKERSSKSLLANVLDLDDDFRRDTSNGSFSVKIDDNFHVCTTRNELHSIIKELKFITNKMKKDEDDSEVSSDWKFAAMVIDRLCLVMFTSFTFISTFAILFSAPHILS